MSVVKKIIKKVVAESVEAIKDSAEQIVQTVGPDALLKHATGQPPANNEFSDYLKGLDKGMSQEEIAKKQAQMSNDDEKQKAALRTYLQSIPAHMRPAPKQQELRPYEKMLQEEAQKAQQVEAQKANKPLAIPVSKQTRGQMGGKRRPKTADFEASKNVKSG